jgi:Holliday junction resolvase RusA-like endonuclease
VAVKRAKAIPLALRFVVDGPPVPQPRHRTPPLRLYGTRTGRKQQRPYLPMGHPVHAYKDAVTLAARGAVNGCKGWDTAGAMELDLLFVLPRPGGGLGTRHGPPGPLTSGGRLWCSRSPDRDNLEKAVTDALAGVIYVNDAQVVDGRTVKVYAAIGERPHVVIRVRALGEAGPGLDISI